MTKPIWAKLTFWRRLAGFHPAIRGAALATATRSGRVFRQYGELAAADPDAFFDQSAHTNAHPFWADAFNKERISVREMLEVGAFEGRTTMFAAKFFPDARITCVDPWVEYVEMKEVRRADETFQRNVAKFGERIRPIRGFSNLVLPRLLGEGERFDIIFIDGSHAYADVVIDSHYAWRLLKPGGTLIWDDYLWRRAEYGRAVPKLAIDQFLSGFRGQYEPLWAFKQVAIRKPGQGAGAHPPPR